MKCNVDIINKFFESEQEQDIKDFVINLLEYRAKGVNFINFNLLALNFYTLEESDKIKTRDSNGNYYDINEEVIINFYTIRKLHKDLRKIILDSIMNDLILNEVIEMQSGESLFSDLDILIEYPDWEKMQRKYKLIELNDN